MASCLHLLPPAPLCALCLALLVVFIPLVSDIKSGGYEVTIMSQAVISGCVGGGGGSIWARGLAAAMLIVGVVIRGGDGELWGPPSVAEGGRGEGNCFEAIALETLGAAEKQRMWVLLVQSERDWKSEVLGGSGEEQRMGLQGIELEEPEEPEGLFGGPIVGVGGDGGVGGAGTRGLVLALGLPAQY
ncbi:hypothetical protein FB451DRAFT_1379619 [Mycena latifolia]|nr:hypothetical protein FB451DRAFT_1379619 [Mycena latifolia]